MRCIVNGIEGGSHTIFRGADTNLNVVIVSDYGEYMGAGTIAAKFYTSDDRSLTATKTVTVTDQVLSIADSDTDLDYGTTYVVYVEHTLTSDSSVTVSSTPFNVEVS